MLHVVSCRVYFWEIIFAISLKVSLASANGRGLTEGKKKVTLWAKNDDNKVIVPFTVHDESSIKSTDTLGWDLKSKDSANIKNWVEEMNKDLGCLEYVLHKFKLIELY